MYKRDQAIALFYRIFKQEDYRWADSVQSPSYAEIEEQIEHLEQSAFDVEGRAECGRLGVKYNKEGETYDYYFIIYGD